MATDQLATDLSGNTSLTVSKKIKCLFITVNEKSLLKYSDIRAYLQRSKQMNYYLCVEHIGQENKHYHILVQYTNNLQCAISKMNGAHIETCQHPAKAKEYCLCKDNKHMKAGITAVIIEEIGELRTNETTRFKTIKQVKEMSREDRDELPIQYKRIIDNMNEEEDNNFDIENIKKDIEVYYIQGESGCGKTERAKQIVRDNKEKYGTKVNMVKFDNNFYLGIGTADIAIYDDFRDSHMKASEFVNFIDYNIHLMNIKGGSKQNKYKLIIITSIQRLDEIYNKIGTEPKKQWIRRIKLIDMYPDYSDIIGNTATDLTDCDIEI